MTLFILKGIAVAIRSSRLYSEFFFPATTHSQTSPSKFIGESAGGFSILKDGGGNILALAAHNWIAVIIHWESDAFQGLKID